MPPRGAKKGTKRARQYQHIKQGQRVRGTGEARSEEIAARTDQLYQEARKLGVSGRSKMNKDQLRRAVDARK